LPPSIRNNRIEGKTSGAAATGSGASGCAPSTCAGASGLLGVTSGDLAGAFASPGSAETPGRVVTGAGFAGSAGMRACGPAAFVGGGVGNAADGSTTGGAGVDVAGAALAGPRRTTASVTPASASTTSRTSAMPAARYDVRRTTVRSVDRRAAVGAGVTGGAGVASGVRIEFGGSVTLRSLTPGIIAVIVWSVDVPGDIARTSAPRKSSAVWNRCSGGLASA